VTTWGASFESVIVIRHLRYSHDATLNGIMLQGRVDRSDPMHLHDQVAAEIRRAISEGEIGSGERLPPSIDLAAVLGVNRNTVLRALRILRDEGIVDFTRGRGVRVTGTPQRSALITKITDLLEFGRQQGYKRDELMSLIEELP
jgi:GntR family transcriptional regulator